MTSCYFWLARSPTATAMGQRLPGARRRLIAVALARGPRCGAWRARKDEAREQKAHTRTKTVEGTREVFRQLHAGRVPPG